MIAHYEFEGNATDRLGSITAPKWAIRASLRGINRVPRASHRTGRGELRRLRECRLFNPTGPFTVAAWIKVAAFDQSGQAILAKGEGGWRIQRR
jgi:hypothetical protein